MQFKDCTNYSWECHKASQQQLNRSQMKFTVTNASAIALTESAAPHTWSQTGKEQIYQQSHFSANNFLKLVSFEKQIQTKIAAPS